MTFDKLIVRLFSMVSLAILAAGIWLAADFGLRWGAAGTAPAELLWWGAGLVAWSVLGGPAMTFLLGRGGDLHGPYARGEGRMIDAPDGARLWTESCGDAHAPALILTHDLGLDASVWREARRELSKRYRVVVWDLPGFGRSRTAPDGRITMDSMAVALESVLKDCGGPAVLAGHGFGGLVVQALMRRRPNLAGGQVAGIVLQNSSFTDPTRTTFLAPLLTPLQAPVLKPLLRLQVLLAPLVALANWQAWLSGWMQIALRLGAFGPAPCRTLLAHASLLACRTSPASQARAMLAAMEFDKDGTARAALRAMRIPALVFVGGSDLAVKPRAAAELASLLRAHENRVGFAGHLGPIECPSWYDHALQAFADDAFTRGAVWADRGAARTEPAEPARARPQGEGRSWSPGAPRAGLGPM